MTLQRRLTLSYAVILTGCLLVLGAAMYYEFVIEYPRTRQTAGFSMTQEVLEVVGVGIPAILLGIAGGWFLVRRGLSPIIKLTSAAERLQEGHLHELLPRSHNRDEIDRLTEVLNEFTARLRGSVEQMREFTFHASHELKTPLTIMRGELEMALRDDFAKADPHALLASQLEEIRRLSRIVESLTLLAKADARLLHLEKKRVPLLGLVKASVEDAETLAVNHRVSLLAGEECVALGDQDRLRQLLLNLTDNALKYNFPAEGTVDFSLVASQGQAVLTIANSGPGLTEEQCAKAFDRFYRGDASHASHIEGSGLGLSLCRWIAEAHEGRISIESRLNGLTVLTVTLPLAPD